MPKCLLCRPEAGLNDMLKQLSICIDYCLRHGRVLVIDSECTSVFASPFRDCFLIAITGLTVRLDATEFLEFSEKNRFTVYPPSGKLRIGAERPYYESDTPS